MSIHLHSDLTQLKVLSDRLAESGNSYFKRNQLIEKIAKKVQDLELDSRVVYSPIHHEIKTEIGRVLNTLDDQLSPVGTKASEGLRKLITKIKGEIENSPIAMTKKPAPAQSKVGLTIAFFSNLDAPDNNKAIINNMIEAIELGFPFITSRSLLNASEVDKDNFTQDAIRKKVLEKAQLWDIYLQKDDKDGEGFVIFLPKGLHFEKTPIEKLELLDFATDGSIVPVTAQEALKGSNKRNKIETFIRLFKSDGKLGKIFYLDGHGSVNTVAGIRAESYTKLREFLDLQNVKALVISSCYSGGASTLYSLDDLDQKKAGFDPHLTHGTYPTIVRSVGDFVSYSGDADPFIKIKSFLTQLPIILEQPHTYSALAQAIDHIDLEELGDLKRLVNISSVHFPSSPGVPQGFQTIQEQAGMHEKLTFQKVRTAMLEHENKIELKSPHSLQIYPQVIPIPVEVAYSAPLLLSVAPGKARHYFHSLSIRNAPSLDEWIKKTADFSKANSLGVIKSYFIGELTVGNKTFQEVVIFQSLEETEYAFKEGDRYWLKRGGQLSPISPLAHRLYAASVQLLAQPSRKALSAATAAQEGEKDFQEAVQNPPFSLGTITPFRLRWLFKSEQLSRPDKEEIIAHLLRANEPEIALELMKEEKIGSVKDIFGTPLLSLAAACRNKEIVAYLLQNGADANGQDEVWKQTALHLACRNEDKELIQELLNASGVDVNRVNWKGYPPYLWLLFMKDLSLFGLFKEKINVNLLLGKKPLISHLIAGKAGIEGIQAVLELNPDLTLGDQSPLIYAQINRASDVVKALLTKGANPFVQDKTGDVPFIEAISKGAEDIVELYLEHPLCDLTIRDTRDMTPFLAALKNGNQKIIELLRKKGGRLPEPMTETDKNIIKDLLRTAAITPDRGLIEELIKVAGMEFWVGEFLIENRQDDYLLQLLKEGKISPNARSGITFFMKIYQVFMRDSQRRTAAEMIKVCLEKGADVNAFHPESPGQNVFYQAIKAHDFSFAQIFFEAGIDLSKTHDVQNVMKQVIVADQLDLVKEMQAKGATIDPDLGIQIPLLLERGSTGQVFQWLVKKGIISINEWKNETTPFLEVVKSGNHYLFEFCLNHEAMTQPTDGKLTSPIYEAALSVNSKGQFLLELLKQGNDLSSSPRDYQNILSTIAHRQSLGTVTSALSLYPEAIHAKNIQKKVTSLHAAAARSDDERIPIFKFLVERGADLNELSAEEKSCVRPFFRTGSLEIIKYCFEKGLQLNEDNQKDVMALALGSGNGELIKFLADKKFPPPSDVKAADGYDKSSNGLLFLTTLTQIGIDLKKLTEEERRELFQAILDKKDQASLRYMHQILGFSDVEIEGIRHFAVSNGQAELLVLLESLQIPYDLDKISTPILEEKIKTMIKQNNPQLLTYFLDKGLDVNKKIGGKTLCELAFEDFSPRDKCVRVLLERGAALPHTVGVDQVPPIYAAVRSRNVALVKLLIEKGIGDDLYKINEKMKENTAVLARRMKNREIITLLFPSKRKAVITK